MQTSKYISILAVLMMICGVIIISCTLMPWYSYSVVDLLTSNPALAEESISASGWDLLREDGMDSYIFLKKRGEYWYLTGAWTLLFGVAIVMLSAIYLGRKKRVLIFALLLIGASSLAFSIIARLPHLPQPTSTIATSYTPWVTSIGIWVLMAVSSITVVLSVLLLLAARGKNVISNKQIPRPGNDGIE